MLAHHAPPVKAGVLGRTSAARGLSLNGCLARRRRGQLAISVIELRAPCAPDAVAVLADFRVADVDVMFCIE